jgi:hypothetical protein|tara:strand:+ start:963 stop:1169 length:207 start_codon:yes stop_codon:yes gene_type:complete
MANDNEYAELIRAELGEVTKIKDDLDDKMGELRAARKRLDVLCTVFENELGRLPVQLPLKAKSGKSYK